MAPEAYQEAEIVKRLHGKAASTLLNEGPTTISGISKVLEEV